MRKFLAFLKRDFLIEASYRFAFALQVGGILLSTGAYYFLARFVGKAVAPGTLEAYGGDYFAFVLVGVALDSYHGMSLDAFSRSVRESQLAGTLEALLTTQTPLSLIVLFSAAFRFLTTSVNVLLYLALGAIFGISLGSANWLAAALVLALSVAVFSSLGIFSASFILVFKRGSPIPLVLGSLSWLLGGILYPVSVLPGALRTISTALPITHAVEGMRAAVLRGASWGELWGSVGPLLAFGCLLLPLSLLSFAYATRRTRISGTLAQY